MLLPCVLFHTLHNSKCVVSCMSLCALCRHFGRSDPILVSCVAELVYQGGQTASILFLTRHHLHIWDKFTDSLIRELAVESCCVSVSPPSTGEHAQLCIRPHPNSGKDTPPDTGYEMVKQYLQQSLVEAFDGGGQGSPVSVFAESAPVVGGDTAPVPGREGPEGVARRDPSGGEGLPGEGVREEEGAGGGEGEEKLVLCFNGLWAEQFHAVWQSTL